MAQEVLTKAQLWDLTRAFRDKAHANPDEEIFMEDVIDVLENFVKAKAPVELDEKTLDTLDKAPEEDSTKPTSFKRICKQCGKEFEGTKKQQLCKDCREANTKAARKNWAKAHSSPNKEKPKADDIASVAQAAHDILALGD